MNKTTNDIRKEIGTLKQKLSDLMQRRQDAANAAADFEAQRKRHVTAALLNPGDTESHSEFVSLTFKGEQCHALVENLSAEITAADEQLAVLNSELPHSELAELLEDTRQLTKKRAAMSEVIQAEALKFIQTVANASALDHELADKIYKLNGRKLRDGATINLGGAARVKNSAVTHAIACLAQKIGGKRIIDDGSFQRTQESWLRDQELCAGSISILESLAVSQGAVPEGQPDKKTYRVLRELRRDGTILEIGQHLFLTQDEAAVLLQSAVIELDLDVTSNATMAA